MSEQTPTNETPVNETEALEQAMETAWHAATAVAEITEDWDTVAVLEQWLKDNIADWVPN